ncbi:DUF1295 domain-containing protein [Amorphus sp. 3PC139-8]|uniref:DUF1295 domain-containing protein n=1 Tax=Amorphus sp. 3PC139-8 TaxID=2735676 RepID=UPI00345D0CCC
MTASPVLILAATLALTLLMFTWMWRIHVAMSDVGVVDYYWGLGFAVLAALELVAGPSMDLMRFLFAAAIGLWALRLTAYLGLRHRAASAEDARYRRMREATGPSFWWRSLFSVFLLQGLLQWLIAAPIHAALAFPPSGKTTWALGTGFILFAIGFVIEGVADWQLARHKRDGSTATLARGLWAWSRHPNYFGEAVLWIGLALVAYGLSGHALAFAGPFLLIVVMVGVSVRVTESHLVQSRPDYAAYRARTSAFLPRPPRPIASGQSERFYSR